MEDFWEYVEQKPHGKKKKKSQRQEVSVTIAPPLCLGYVLPFTCNCLTEVLPLQKEPLWSRKKSFIKHREENGYK